MDWYRHGAWVLVCFAAGDLRAALVLFKPRHTPYEEVRNTNRVCEPVVGRRTSWRSESSQRQIGQWQDPPDGENTTTKRRRAFGFFGHESQHAIRHGA